MFCRFIFTKRIIASGVFTLIAAPCLADRIDINFQGAIAEEPCSISTNQLNYAADNPLGRQDGQQVLSRSPLELDLHCHAAQAVDISFEQGGRETRAGFGTGVDGVVMTMTHNGRSLPPGDAIVMAMEARQHKLLRLDTQLLGVAMPAKEKVRSSILVSLNYR